MTSCASTIAEDGSSSPAASKHLEADAILKIDQAIAAFDAFTSDNDPYGEHDFGAVTVDGQVIFFKIDYYDADLLHLSPDPANPALTCRVMTIMLADEY